MEQTDRDCSPSAGSLRTWIEEAHRKKDTQTLPRGSAAVLIPILIRDGKYHVLYEVRAAKLHTQPGEICFPGGRIEEGEEPLEAAVREVTEELCIRRDQIEVIGKLDETIGPGAIPFFAYIGVLHGYEGTWSRAEVEEVFTVPLDWILAHDPVIYRVRLDHRLPEDFPYEYVPGGRDYKWRSQYYPVPFYPDVRPSTAPALAWDAGMEPALESAHMDVSGEEKAESAPLASDAAPALSVRSCKPEDKAEGAALASGGMAGRSLDGKSPDRKSPDGKSPDRKSPDGKSPDGSSAASEPVLWGVTARVTHSLTLLLRTM